jgi:hypothetical protein
VFLRRRWERSDKGVCGVKQGPSHFIAFFETTPVMRIDEYRALDRIGSDRSLVAGFHASEKQRIASALPPSGADRLRVHKAISNAVTVDLQPDCAGAGLLITEPARPVAEVRLRLIRSPWPKIKKTYTVGATTKRTCVALRLAYADEAMGKDTGKALYVRGVPYAPAQDSPQSLWKPRIYHALFREAVRRKPARPTLPATIADR